MCLSLQAFIRILRCQWKKKRKQGWQAYYNYRSHQGSNTSSFLNGSQQTLSSVNPSPRCVASRLSPSPWNRGGSMSSASSQTSSPITSQMAHKGTLPGSAGGLAVAGASGRGKVKPVSPLARDAATGLAVRTGTGIGVLVNGQNGSREVKQQDATEGMPEP